MPRRAFVFDPPDRFVAGTIGAPGNRTFFLQAREGGRVVSVVLEKAQSPSSPSASGGCCSSSTSAGSPSSSP